MWHDRVGRSAGRSCIIVILTFLSTGLAQAQSQNSGSSDLQQLKDKLQRLDQEMQELKTEINAAEKQPGAGANLTAVAVGATSESNKPEAGKGSSIDLYGFVMLDSGNDFGQSDPNWFDVMRPTKLPAFKNEFGGNGNVFFSVRQTRFGLKTTTPTGWGQLKTQFEFELFGTGVDAGQTTFRLRHAYGELG